MSINTLVAALELKPKSEHLQSQQKIKKLVRRNASDKLKLIQMVHDNPILWDSRLPNFKGAEGEKNRAWEQIGKELNAPGRRVARAFKSLRESYRRELAHVKVMGSNFKPKWSLYEAMDFLRDVIRERKGGSQSAENSLSVSTIGLNLSSAFGLHNNDIQHQHHHHHHHHHLNNKNNNNNNNIISKNNNCNNKDKTSNVLSDNLLLHHKQHSPIKFNDTVNALNLQQQQQQQQQQQELQQHSPTFNNDVVTALNLSKCSSTSLSLSNEDFYKFVKPELDFSNNNNNNNNHHINNNHHGASLGVVAAQQMALHVAHARHHLLNNKQDQNDNSVTASTRPSTPINGNAGLSISNDSRVTSTHNDNHNIITSCNSTQNTLFDETGDGVDGSSIRSGAVDGDGAGTGDDENNTNAGNLSHSGSIGEEVEELEAIDADFPYPFILDSNSTNNGCLISKRRRKDILSDNDDDDDDDYEMQMMKQHRRLRRHQHHAQGHINGNGGVGAVNSHHMLDIPQPQTVREVLNSKFCGFISAKLNSMEDSEADNLMNKILMLLVQTQTNELK